MHRLNVKFCGLKEKDALIMWAPRLVVGGEGMETWLLLFGRKPPASF